VPQYRMSSPDVAWQARQLSIRRGPCGAGAPPEGQPFE